MGKKSKSIKTAGMDNNQSVVTHTAPLTKEAPPEVITKTEDFAGKGEGKNVRAPIGEESDVNKLSHEDKVRMATGKQLRLDASFYERLPEYQGKQLFWERTFCFAST